MELHRSYTYSALEGQTAGALSERNESSTEIEKISLEGLGTIKIVAILSLALCFTGSQVSGFLVGPGINFIADDLGLGEERSWIVVSQSLASACLAPCAGYLQDMIGRRASLALALVFAIVGNIVSGTANDFVQLVVGSTLSGMGNAVQELTAIAAVAELVPAKKRGLFLALNIGSSAGFAPAVLYAQLLSSGSQWRWLFWISLIWNVATTVGLCASYFRMHVDRLSAPKERPTFWQLDWVGIILLTTGLTIFLVALQSGGQSYGWTSAYVLTQLLVGIAAIALFIFWESRDIGRPLIPFRLFKGQRVVALALGVGAMGGVNYSVILNLGPTIIQTAFDETKVGFGLLALGPGLGLVVGAVVVNVSLSSFGQYSREILTLSATIMTTFLGAEAVITPHNPDTFAIMSTFASLGTGAVIIPVTTLVTLASPEDLIGTAVALTTTVRSVAGTIGYTILYNIYLTRSATTTYQQMSPLLSEAGIPKSSIPKFIKAYVSAISDGDLQDIPRANASVLAAASQGFRAGTAQAAQLVYYVSIAFGAVGILFAACLPNMKQYMTDKVLVRSNSRDMW